MNRQHIASLLVVLALLCTPPAAMAIDAPHDLTTIASGGKGYTCSTCHIVHRTAGTKGIDNICQKCHYPGRDTNVSKRKVAWGDGSNLFGNNTTAAKLGGVQNSHAWTASDTVPAAGSQAPTSPLLNKLSIKGRVSCVRCHAIHNSKNSTTTSKPYIRMMNDTDQLCLDCHRSRKTTDHKVGTHPVTMRYTTAIRKYPNYSTHYYKTILNANPANPTSNLGSYLKKGQVVCSTCHRPHAADSSSASFDSMSSAGQVTQPDVKSGLGVLLRTDMRRASGDDPNICQNCHKRENHDRNSRSIQCTDCHGGHVGTDFRGQVVSTPYNYYVVNRFMNYSVADPGSAKNKAVFYQSTSGSPKWYFNAGNTGVCQVCHKIPETPNHVHTSWRTNAAVTDKDCRSCHKHYNPGYKSFEGPPSLECGNCHGMPPRKNAQGDLGTGGYAYYSSAGTGKYDYKTASGGTIFKDESKTPHKRHSYGYWQYMLGGGAFTNYSAYNMYCDQCHKGNNHYNGTFQEVFVDKTGIIGVTAGANPSYNSTTGRCTNVYCHSNGAPRLNAADLSIRSLSWKTTPAWTSGAGTIYKTAQRCTACHGYKPTTNVHTRHVDTSVGKNYGCAVCHAATVFDTHTSIIFKDKKHVDGSATLSFKDFAGAPAAGTAWTAGTAACSASKCHSDGTGGGTGAPKQIPTWTTSADNTTGKCGRCHYTTGKTQLAPTPYSGGYLPKYIDSSRHLGHYSSSYGPKIFMNLTSARAPKGCARCHVYTTDLAATHVNAVVNLQASPCGTCHPNQASTYWSAGASRLTCTECHGKYGPNNPTALSVIDGVAAPFKPYTTYTNRGHGNPASPNYDYIKNNFTNTCTACHNPGSTHISGVLGDAKRLKFSPNDNTLCADCHNDAARVPTAAKRNMVTHVSSMDCKKCHDVHGGSVNARMIKRRVEFNALSTAAGRLATIDFTNYTTGFVNLVTNRGICQICHTSTNHFNRNRTESSSHTDAAHKRCLGCHPHNDPNYAFRPVGGGECNGCHGYPPADADFTPTQINYSTAKVADYNGGGGAHTVAAHIPKNARPGQGWTLCTPCHSQGDSGHVMDTGVWKTNVTVDVDDAYKFNNTKPLDATQYRIDIGKTTGKCWNASCHFKPTPQWSTN